MTSEKLPKSFMQLHTTPYEKGDRVSISNGIIGDIMEAREFETKQDEKKESTASEGLQNFFEKVE